MTELNVAAMREEVRAMPKGKTRSTLWHITSLIAQAQSLQRDYEAMRSSRHVSAATRRRLRATVQL